MRDGFPQLSQEQFFFGRTPRWSRRVIYWAFGPFWAAGHLEKFRARVKKQKKRNFPVLGVPKRGEKVTTLSGMVVRNFLTVHVLTDRAPNWWENAKYEDFGPFWPRTTVGTYKNPEPGPKTENRNFPVLRGPK